MSQDEAKPDDFQKIKESAFRLLARRDHSAFELKQKLKQKFSLADETFQTLLSYLNNLGYMADENVLSQRWVKQWRAEGRGRQWIQGKLRTKGLPQIDLRDDENELESAKEFLKKKLSSSIEKLDYKKKAKLARSMISRGFSGPVVATLLKEIN
ncbi:MAG: regulatory protein RecX [Oligoflexia bacterium]|nr:regulatory protein RecX [Oligoflexia bacterium]